MPALRGMVAVGSGIAEKKTIPRSNIMNLEVLVFIPCFWIFEALAHVLRQAGMVEELRHVVRELQSCLNLL